MRETVFLREEIYLAYRDKVTAYVRNRVADRYEAEDVVSEVFLKVYQKLECYDNSRGSLSTWIYTITRNTVIDYYKKKKTLNSFSDEIAKIEETSDEILEYENLLKDLANALEKLSERERDLIILHYHQGYTLKRIAEMMGMSYINAKVIHAKALSALRRLLN